QDCEIRLVAIRRQAISIGRHHRYSGIRALQNSRGEKKTARTCKYRINLLVIFCTVVILSYMSCLNCLKRPSIKKVSFSDLITVKHYNQTLVDSNICWQRTARDRMRCRRRINDAEQTIGWVFSTPHRSRVYNALYL